MSQENLQSNKEALEILRNSILATERAMCPPESLALYDAENAACFSLYMEDMGTRDPELVEEALQSGTGAEKLLSDYIMFRTDTEVFVKEHKERAWASYIEALTLGDSAKAEDILRKALSEEEDEEE